MGKKILFVQSSLDEAGGASVAQKSLINVAILNNFDVYAITLDGLIYDKLGAKSYTKKFVFKKSFRFLNIGFNRHVVNFILEVGKNVNPDIIVVGNVSWFFSVLEGIKGIDGIKYRIVHGAENFCLNSMLTKGRDKQVCEGGFGLKCLSYGCEPMMKFPFKLGLHYAKNHLSSNVFDGFIVHSNYMFEKLERIYKDRVFHLPLTTDIEFVYENDKINIGRILFVGSLVWHKGVNELIHAAKLLDERGYDFTLSLAGTGIEKENLKKFVELNKLDEKVFFLGVLDRREVINEIAKADVVAFPSYFESFGLVALESMVLKKKLVISKRGALKEIASSYPYAYFIDDITAECIAHKIEVAFKETNREMKWDNPYTVENLSLKLNEVFI